MNNLLYSFSYWKQPVVVLPVLGVIIILFMRIIKWLAKKIVIWLDGLNEENISQIHIKWYKMSEVELYIIVLLTLLGLVTLGEYIEVAHAYKNNIYQVVEGYVENFDPQIRPGHKCESFKIRDVYFQYDESDVTCGYNKRKSRGGVIKENGQHLKIGYVNNGGLYTTDGYKPKNVIVYIEQLDDEVQPE